MPLPKETFMTIPGLPSIGPVAWDDALSWLPTLPSASARAAIFDPPYAVGTPVRGREDGAAGAVFGPLSFMSRALREVSRVLMPGGIALIFADWRRMPDLIYIASTVGLRAATQVPWIRSRPGTGGLLRASWDPITVVARGVPDAVDRSAIRNVIETVDPIEAALDGLVVRADYPVRRRHPYGKPPEVYRHILARVCRPGDLVIDPFAGSGASRAAAEAIGCRWQGCDIDPEWAVIDAAEVLDDDPDCPCACHADDLLVRRLITDGGTS